MTVDLKDIPWSDITPHSVVFVRLEGERLDRFVYALRDQIGDSVKVVPMNVDTEILVIEEETLNRMGWFRKP